MSSTTSLSAPARTLKRSAAEFTAPASVSKRPKSGLLPFDELIKLAKNAATPQGAPRFLQTLQRHVDKFTPDQEIQLWSLYVRSHTAGYTKVQVNVLRAAATRLDKLVKASHEVVSPSLYQRAMLDILEAMPTCKAVVDATFNPTQSIADHLQVANTPALLQFLQHVGSRVLSSDALLVDSMSSWVRTLQGHSDRRVAGIASAVAERFALYEPIKDAVRNAPQFHVDSLERSAATIYAMPLQGHAEFESHGRLNFNRTQELLLQVPALPDDLRTRFAHIQQRTLISRPFEQEVYVAAQRNEPQRITREAISDLLAHSAPGIPVTLGAVIRAKNSQHAIGLAVEVGPLTSDITLVNSGFGLVEYHQMITRPVEKAKTLLPSEGIWKQPQSVGNCLSKNQRVLRSVHSDAATERKMHHYTRAMYGFEVERKAAKGAKARGESFRNLSRRIGRRELKTLLRQRKPTARYANFEFRISEIPDSRVVDILQDFLTATLVEHNTIQEAASAVYERLGTVTFEHELQARLSVPAAVLPRFVAGLAREGAAFERGPSTRRSIHVTPRIFDLDADKFARTLGISATAIDTALGTLQMRAMANGALKPTPWPQVSP